MGGGQHTDGKGGGQIRKYRMLEVSYSTSTFTAVASHFNYKSVFGVLERNLFSFCFAASAQTISGLRVRK